tara:strand:+ start:39 stop:527 length:489 start_codon:yes stop_codon:yes gene_type:complete
MSQTMATCTPCGKPSYERKKSTNAQYVENWIASGRVIPLCVNHGCKKEVAIRHWSAQGDPSLKTECGKCSRNRIHGKTIQGVIFHKKSFCQNKDGILGFTCPMDPERYHEFSSDIFDMDHLDGNHLNNTPENVITLCKVCHAMKGKLSGDFNSQKASSRKPK